MKPEAQARQYLDKAVTWMDRLQAGTDRVPGWLAPPLCRSRLELAILRREAEKLIGK